MRIVVLIAAHNEEAHLGAQLEALLSQTWDGDWRVIVVDNRSTDGTAAVVAGFAANHPRLSILHVDERADKCYAINTAMSTLDADAYLFSDGDDVVGDGWLEAMAKGLGVAEVVTGPNELERLNPSWIANSRGQSASQACGSYVGIFPCVRGNNFGIRASVWDRIGLYEEGYFPVEDIEFSLRCWLNNISIVGVQGAVVHYRYRLENRSLWRQGFSYGRGRPSIARRLKDLDKPTPSSFSGWRSWVLLLVSSPGIVLRSRRAVWIWIAANRCGQIAGSIKHRIVMV